MMPTQLTASGAVLRLLSGAAVASHKPDEGRQRLDGTDHGKLGDPKDAAHVIRVAMRDGEFPILGPNSVFAAKSAMSAYGEGRYVAFHEALLRAKGVASGTSPLHIAAEIGLDAEPLKADRTDAATRRNLVDKARNWPPP